jgi:short-subunit dehydrogenase
MNTSSSKGVALVTGSSTGIGAVYADRLAKRGYDLILVARDKQKLQSVADRIKSETNRSVEIIAADLTQKADLGAVENRLRSDSTITLLVNNAGLGATAQLIDSNLDDLQRMIDLNVTALTRLSGAVVPAFVSRGKGIIINIASIVALAPEILNGAYSGSKAYVVNFTQSMHLELKDKGIQVQAVLPGAIDTPFWDKTGFAVTNLPDEMVMSPEDLVDAALAGLDQGEVITIPALADIEGWNKLDGARKALGSLLSNKNPAQRYLSTAAV